MGQQSINYFASSDPDQLWLQQLRMWPVFCILLADLGLQLLGICGGAVSVVSIWGRRPGAPAANHLWGLYLLSLSGVADLGFSCRGYGLAFAFGAARMEPWMSACWGYGPSLAVGAAQMESWESYCSQSHLGMPK